MDSKTVVRRHSRDLKSEVLAACVQPGTSVAAVSPGHGLNANPVHKWRRSEARGVMSPRAAKVVGAFIALPLPRSAVASSALQHSHRAALRPDRPHRKLADGRFRRMRQSAARVTARMAAVRTAVIQLPRAVDFRGTIDPCGRKRRQESKLRCSRSSCAILIRGILWGVKVTVTGSCRATLEGGRELVHLMEPP